MFDYYKILIPNVIFYGKAFEPTHLDEPNLRSI